MDSHAHQKINPVFPLVYFLVKLPLLKLLHESHCLILAEPSARPGTYFMALPSRTAGLAI